jgi:hypothetical protein
MRCGWFSLVVLIGCGSGDGEPDPSVGILSASCDLIGADTIGIMVEAETVLATGQGVEFEVSTLGAPGTGVVSDAVSCGVWELTMDGEVDAGCQRVAGQAEQETVGLIHTETPDDPLPAAISITITVNARSEPLGGTIVTSDGMSIDCN